VGEIDSAYSPTGRLRAGRVGWRSDQLSPAIRRGGCQKRCGHCRGG